MISEVGGGQWGLAGATETLLAIDPATVTQMHQVDAASTAVVRRLDDKGVLVRDTVAEHHGWKVGDLVPMTFARGRNAAGPHQGAVLDHGGADRLRHLPQVVSSPTTPSPCSSRSTCSWRPGSPRPRRRPMSGGSLADLPVVKVMGRAQVLAAQQAQVDKLLAPVAALLGLSVLIGLLGIANALALSIHERTRELGLLRAVGMARTQLRSMIRCEAVIIAGLGSVLGLALSLGFGWASVAAIRHLGVTKLVFPVGQLGLLVAAASGAGLLAAVLPARRAARLQVLDAVGHGQ